MERNIIKLADIVCENDMPDQETMFLEHQNSLEDFFNLYFKGEKLSYNFGWEVGGDWMTTKIYHEMGFIYFTTYHNGDGEVYYREWEDPEGIIAVD